MTREVKVQECPSPPSATWAEKLAVARTALTDSVKARYPRDSGKHVGRALRKLAQIAQDTGETAKDNFSYPVVITDNNAEADRAFIGYLDKERGCERFNIRKEDIAYMVRNPQTTMVLAAEVITNTKVFGFTAVKSFELHHNARTDEDRLYFAVRLTPRRFKNPNPTLLPDNPI